MASKKSAEPTPAPVQPTRMLKIECPRCGCLARMTRKWLDEVGTPTCGCGTKRKMREAA